VILEEMGVPLWAERARAELGRIGGRAATDGLTPTEQRVADLVAEGRSNKDVAAELFVSVRTVEANLTRVYAKLGIRSRTELAAIRQASGGRSRSPAQPPAPLS
jgi:DNA-binding CsgD family transcriptional regulator